MIKSSTRLNFGFKSCESVTVEKHIRARNLDGHRPIQVRIVSLVDDSERSSSDDAFEHISADTRAHCTAEWSRNGCRLVDPELVQSPNHFGRIHRAEVGLFAVFRHFILV